jgi:hypothetical protein
MIFLIEYDRREGNIIEFRRFDNSQRVEAQDARLKTELELNRKGLHHEVVLLDAETEEMLRKTHRRYFESLRQLLHPLLDRLPSADRS